MFNLATVYATMAEVMASDNRVRRMLIESLRILPESEDGMRASKRYTLMKRLEEASGEVVARIVNEFEDKENV
eukprot:gene31128-38466_t